MENDGIEIKTEVKAKPQAPRTQDFYIINTKLDPRAFLDFLNKEVLGSYEVCDTQVAGAEFGFSIMQYGSMILAKFDTGSWPWYDAASEAIIQSIVWRLNCRAWVCGWAVDKAWSWVDGWRPHRKTGKAKQVGTVDGPHGLGVTIQAKERWGIDTRAAFDHLMKTLKWEALRQWLTAPEPKPGVAHVSFTFGKRLMAPAEGPAVAADWAREFPDRQPGDGPLHLQAYYLLPAIRQKLERERGMTEDEKRKALSLRTEPPFSGL